MLQQIWCAILELSHNEAAAAFIGAGAAFFLVVANDWRRRRIRAFRSMPSRIQSLRFAAKQLITSGIDTLLVEPASTMDMMTDWMRPPLLGLRELAADVDDLLDEEERFAAQAIFFLLDSLNRNLDELERLTAAYFTKHRAAMPSNPEAASDRQLYREKLQDARKLAEELVKICERSQAVVFEAQIASSVR